VAAYYQHRNDDRHFPDGVSYSKYAEPRRRAINLMLDELIHAIDAAADQMIDIETLSDEELDAMQAKYGALVVC